VVCTHALNTPFTELQGTNMDAGEITFLIVLIGMIAGIYFIYRIVRERDSDENDEDIWS
jgi:hypothetical protein